MKTLIRWMGLTLLLFSLVAVNAATAAPAVGAAKARGDSSQSIRHARDYSQGDRWYARRAPSIAPQIARDEAAGLGQNITAAQRQFAEVHKVTAATDKKTSASLAPVTTIEVGNLIVARMRRVAETHGEH
jgi:hypothetical protein